MAQSDIPTPLSQPQILGEMLDSVTSRLGIRKFKVGSPILSILEAVSQSLTRATYGAFKALQARDVDNVEGIGLQRIGNDEELPQFGPVAASTAVTITDTRYTRIASNLYHGLPAPIVGSASLYVDKTPTLASAPASGVLYIGRGSTQQEGPLVYTSKTDSGNYWTISLSTPTTAFHNQGEEVVIGQGGDRNINAGQIVSTPAGALSTPVQYSVLVGGVLPDGEVSLNGLAVTCLTPGLIGNVPEGAISDFGGSPPFLGAAVTNPNRVTDGRDTESTKDYRSRIKNTRNSRSRATDLALKNAVLNITSPDEQKTVLSSSILRRFGKPSVVYIDDGNGYEPISEGVGYEVLRANATGGETDFQTIQSPIVKASVETTLAAPFSILNGTSLEVSVGFNVPQVHFFDTSTFNSPLAASAYDVVSSVNSDTQLQFSARVSSNGTKVTLFTKEEIGQIAVTGGTAKDSLGFPANQSYTSLLFINDHQLGFFEYTLDRATGAIILNNSLNVGDNLTLGSLWTQGFLESANISTLTISDTPLWFVVDGNTTVVDTGNSLVSTLTVSIANVTPSCFHLTIQNSSNFSSNVAIGQNILLYQTANNNLPSALVGSWKIIDVPAPNQVVIEFPCMKSARKMAAAVVLPTTTTVMVCGGLCSQNTGALASCEIYDTVTGLWTSTAPMSVARYGHTATVLNNGLVFVAGGTGVDGTPLTSTELYNPTTHTWSNGPSLSLGLTQHSAILLTTGNVLIVGGITPTTITNNSIEYVAVSGTLSYSNSFVGPRYSTSLVTLPDATVMMVGGLSSTDSGSTDEGSGSVVVGCSKYTPTSHTWTEVASVPLTSPLTRFRNYVAELLNSTTVIAVADKYYYTYNISGNAWTSHGAIATVPNFDPAETAYNGTSVAENSDPTILGQYLYFGRANPLIKTANGTIVLPFTELSKVTGPNTDRKFCHIYYNTGTSSWTKIPSTLTVAGCKSLFAATHLSNQAFIFGGQSDSSYFDGGEVVISATVETIDTTALATTYFSPMTGAYAGTQGWVIYNTTAPTIKTVIPSSTYVTESLSDAISITGASSDVYRTSKIRLSTNDNTGDLIELGPSIAGTTSETLQKSGVSLSANIKSSRSEIDIPANFMAYSIGSIEGSSIRIPFQVESTLSGNIAEGLTVDTNLFKNCSPPLNAALRGLTRKNFLESHPSYAASLHVCDWTGTIQSNGSKEWGNFKNEIARIGSWSTVGSIPDETAGYSAFSDSTLLGTSSSVSISPNQPFYCGMPFRFTNTDRLSVIVDQNTTSGFFSIPMARKVKASNTTYGPQITVNDAENSNLPLAQQFGLTYSFNNFDVLMKARNIVGGILYRFYRPGPEGENYIVRYSYPTTPNQATSVSIDHGWDTYTPTYSHAQKSFINIGLPSGPLYTGNTLTPTTRLTTQQVEVSGKVSTVNILVGFSVVQGERTAIGGTTRLRVQYPDSTISNVFTVGDFIRFDAVTPTPNTLLSGQTRITAVGASSGGQQDLTISAGSLDDGTAVWTLTANPGTVSLDPSAIAKVGFDPTIVVGDIVILNSPLHCANTPIRITAIGSTNQYLKGRMLSTVAVDGTYPNTDTLVVPSRVTIFGKPTPTEASLVSDITALAAATNSTCPITATLLGTGTTAITTTDWDNNTAWDSGTPLLDGFNAVLGTIAPGSVAIDTQLTLKRPTAAGLAVNSDWINEDIYLLPSYAVDVAKWLNTPCITGLWSQALINTANSGTSVQITSNTLGSTSSIQVSGVGANQATATIVGSAQLPNHAFPSFIVSTNASSASGFRGGDMVKITNTTPLSKKYVNSDSGTIVESIFPDGYWTLANFPFNADVPYNNTTTASFEKAGNFCVIKLNSPCLQNPNYRSPGQYIYIDAPAYHYGTFTSTLPNVSNGNKGVFKIINVTHNGSVIWIENETVVEEKSVCDFNFLSHSSIIPGDVLVVTDSRFGTGNVGSWTVVAVGETVLNGSQFTSSRIRVSTQDKSPAQYSGIQTMDGSGVQVLEGTPSTFYKKILGINPNQDNGTLVDIKLTDMGMVNVSPTNTTVDIPEYSFISNTAGSIMESLNKLDFPTDLHLGIDAYRYNTGLVGEAKKVLYGTSDTQTYPGFVANGASVLIDGPVIKRIQRAFAVRAIGDPSDALADRVRSVISGVINSSPHGQDISVSDLVSAGAQVDGVVTITPLFDGDQIAIAASEKGMVVNPTEDISIIFAGL